MPAFLNKLAVRVSVCLAFVVLGVIFALCFRLPEKLILQPGDNAYLVGWMRDGLERLAHTKRYREVDAWTLNKGYRFVVYAERGPP